MQSDVRLYALRSLFVIDIQNLECLQPSLTLNLIYSALYGGTDIQGHVPPVTVPSGHKNCRGLKRKFG